MVTGGVHRAQSTDTGNYTLSQLPVGVYEVAVVVPGFKQYIRRGLTVEVAQTIRIDIGLEVGNTTESVNVQADAALLKTEGSELSHIVRTQTLDDLPIVGIGSVNAGSSQIRNAYAVTQLIPGQCFAPNAVVKINGAPANQQVYRVEGQDSTLGYANQTPAQVQPSVDAIEETAIQTSNYAAEYGGGGGGGVFNVTTKSGTNQYHGTVYDYFVNEALNAAQPFTNDGSGDLIRQRNRRNDYGFTVGGPVSLPKIYNGHDKAFFFLNFEQVRGTDIVSNTPLTVPTNAYRSGNFSAALGRSLGTDPAGHSIIENSVYDPATQRLVNGSLVRDAFPNNTIPLTRQDPVALKIQALIPLPETSATVNNLLPVFPADRRTSIPSSSIINWEPTTSSRSTGPWPAPIAVNRTPRDWRTDCRSLYRKSTEPTFIPMLSG